MNKTYRTIWNAKKQAWVAVAEFASTCGKESGSLREWRLPINRIVVPLALGVAVLPCVHAASYTVNNQAELIQAITDANNDGDAISTIEFGSIIDIGANSLHLLLNKPIEINTNGFKILANGGEISLSGVGISGISAPELTQTTATPAQRPLPDTYIPPTAGNANGGINIESINRFSNSTKITGGQGGGLNLLIDAFSGKAGNGDLGVIGKNIGEFLNNAGASISGGAGGSIDANGLNSGGNGVSISAGQGGVGIQLTNSNLNNQGVISGGGGGDINDMPIGGGDNQNGGAGGKGAVLIGGEHTNSGSIQGGMGGIGSNAGDASTHGASAQAVDLSGGAKFVNTSTGVIVGAAGREGGLTNKAGGIAGADAIVISDTSGILIENYGTIRGGSAGFTGVTAGSAISGENLTVINGGKLEVGGGGSSASSAIKFTGGINRLELHANSYIDGNVVAVNSGSDVLAFGGQTDASFATNQLGVKYQNFSKYEKLGTSTLTLTGTSAGTQPWFIEEGVLSISNDASLGSDTADLNFNGGALQITGTDVTSIARLINIDTKGGEIEVVDASLETQIQQGITGDGGLVKTGAGTLTFNGVNAYKGVTHVRAGTVRAAAQDVFSIDSKHKIDAGAVLNLNGFNQSIASMDLSGGGEVVLSNLGQSATTLTTKGDWIGGGLVKMNVPLLDGSTSGDRIVVDGGSVTGTTSLDITNVDSSQLGAQTVGDGILLVEAVNGADTTAQGSKNGFKLLDPRGHIDAGAFEYRLYAADAAGNGENWFLRSNLPADPASTPGPVTYRNEIPLVSAMSAQLQQADLVMLANLHKRMGDESTSLSGVQKQSRHKQGWARMLRTDMSMSQAGTVNPSSSGHMTGFQAGIGLYANANFVGGIYVGHLQGNIKTSGFASGVEGKYVGSNDLRNNYLGIYATWWHDSGFYTDAVLQVADYSVDVKALNASSQAKAKGQAWLASMEMGWTYALSSRWEIEPQAQIIYRQAKMDDTDLHAASVEYPKNKDWLLRLGARIKGNFVTDHGLVQPYGRINVYKASKTDSVLRVSTQSTGTDIKTKGGYSSSELAMGGTWQISKRFALYGEVGKLWANGSENKIKNSVQLSIGGRIQW